MARDLVEVSLDDKYTRERGRVLISGVQALVRLPMMQRARDVARGLNTGGFISGYRGSPLGGFDSALWREAERLAAQNIRFQPAVNEDLAATACWGTQQLDALPGATVDGVFAMWYGKGPGVERSTDAIHHGNYAGTHANGGVLVVYGDDHAGTSSTSAHQSDQTLAALSVPSLYPADVAEFLRFGLLGWEMSRFTGLWVGFKCVNETVEQTATVALDDAGADIVVPERRPEQRPPGGVNINPHFFGPGAVEQVVTRYRLPLVHDFVRANGMDRCALGAARPRVGIVTAGKSYKDVGWALDLLGLDAARMEALGVGVWKVGCIWPLEPQGIAGFAAGAEALLFVEDKHPVLEDQARAILYDTPNRPAIWGKKDGQGNRLFPSDVAIASEETARALYRLLGALGRADAALEAAHDRLTPPPLANAPVAKSDTRVPYFCSGCPHNTSTRLPDGSRAFSGIGCHTLVLFNGKDTTMPPTQMGGEGANWIGLAPFTETQHMFQNIGDGTYFHSGLLAIRAAVAAGVNVTYKILYNDAVAMTGGQPLDGPISVGRMAAQLLAEGVARVEVVSENPAAYGRGDLPDGVRAAPRDALDRIQTELRDVPGTTAIIYEQTCAAEKRRRRKRGRLADPDTRVFINEAVCEGCGDCSVQSGCMSILPKPTPLGVKRQIDQSACNKDYTCLKGFCPAMVTVEGGSLRKPEAAAIAPERLENLPAPAGAAVEAQSVMVCGIGGTGVVTVGAVLAMAAHLEGRAASVFDVTGLAQKNGAVYSHIRLGAAGAELGPQRIGAGEADLVLAFDMMAAADAQALKTLDPARSTLIGNSAVAPGAAFQFAASEAGLPDGAAILDRLLARTGPGRSHLIDGTRLALAASGDTIAINMMMVGYALQLGAIGLSAEAIERAIELNGVAVEFNRRAFRVGRLSAVDPGFAAGLIGGETGVAALGLEEHAGLVAAYQNDAWAARYRGAMARLAEAEAARGVTGLVDAAVPVLSRLMRYKDEYEVARLMTDPGFDERLNATFEGPRQVAFHMAPPILSRTDVRTGRPAKRALGPWLRGPLRLLAGLKGLRGTAFDPFGRTEERQLERGLIDWYEGLIARCAGEVDAATAARWRDVLAAPDGIRGFGPVKAASVTRVKAEVEALLAAL